MPDHDEPEALADASEEQAARLERALDRIAAAAQSASDGRGPDGPEPLGTAREIVGRLDALIGQLRAALGPASVPDS